jgi:hypothetical protein
MDTSIDANFLRDVLPIGATVYLVSLHNRGPRRHFKVLCAKDSQLHDITAKVARVTRDRLVKHKDILSTQSSNTELVRFLAMRLGYGSQLKEGRIW